MNTRMPIISLIIAAAISGLMLLPESLQAALYYDHQAVMSGTYYSLLTGHFMHSDFNHWLWNCLAMLTLGTVIELTSKRLLAGCLLAGIAGVDILLLSAFSPLDYYCGLSGVLNSLLVVALWQIWQQTRSQWVIASVLLCIGKIFIETNSQQSLITHISWPPYPAAHGAGATAGLLVVLWLFFKTYNTASSGNILSEKTFSRFNKPT